MLNRYEKAFEYASYGVLALIALELLLVFTKLLTLPRELVLFTACVFALLQGLLSRNSRPKLAVFTLMLSLVGTVLCVISLLGRRAM